MILKTGNDWDDLLGVTFSGVPFSHRDSLSISLDHFTWADDLMSLFFYGKLREMRSKKHPNAVSSHSVHPDHCDALKQKTEFVARVACRTRVHTHHLRNKRSGGIRDRSISPSSCSGNERINHRLRYSVASSGRTNERVTEAGT